MLFVSSLLMSTVQAGVFSPADDDGDGIPDRRDGCLALPETYNGYADDDGCPDHLAFLDVVPTIGGRAVPAEVTVMRSTGTTVAAAPRVATDLVPSESVTIEAKALCWVGSATIAVGPHANRIEVPLSPRFDQTLDLDLAGPDGRPIEDAVVTLDGPCAPTGALHLADGQGRIRVGEGPHRMRIEAPGYVSVSQYVSAGDGPVGLTLAFVIPEGDDVVTDDAVADGV